MMAMTSQVVVADQGQGSTHLNLEQQEFIVQKLSLGKNVKL